MFSNKRYLLLGYGISNKSVRHYFDIKKIPYVIYDDFDSKHKPNIDFNSFDIVVKSPIIKDDNWLVQISKKLNKEIVTDLELFYRYTKHRNIITVTGTNGKTTTVNLLKVVFDDMDLAGNLGIPLFDYVESEKDIIIEASSFMLEYISAYKSKYNVFLNISSNHLDHHHSMLNYISSKLNLLKNISNEDHLIYNYDDLILRDYLKDVNCLITPYSLTDRVGVYLEGSNFYYKDKKLINIDDIKLLGDHNLSNIASVLAVVVNYYDLSNINLDILEKRIRNFGGIEHRLEYVTRFKDVKVYNDSKSTNLIALKAALNSFNDKKILLIIGGKESDEDLHSLKDYVKNVVRVLINGENSKKLKRLFSEIKAENYSYDNLESLMDDLPQKTSDIDVVLFSPGSVSYDQFTNFEERGNYFKYRIFELVKNL